MPSLAGKTAVVTGSSRGIGAETAKLLAAGGANVVVNYREKALRAHKVVQEIEEAGGHAISVGADLTDPGAVRAMMRTAVDTFGGLDVLVLNASGGMEPYAGTDYAMRLNRDAQLDTLLAGAELMGKGGRVVFVTSHPAHFIREVRTIPEYEWIACCKRAGEDALTDQIPALSAKGISFVTVSGDVIEGTITAMLLNWAQKGALEARSKEIGDSYSVAEFAREIVAMTTASVGTGHVELVGGAKDFLEQAGRTG